MHEQVLKRILQQSEIDAVIPGSTPVISFGDFTKAKVATLGINPSSAEFLSGKKLIASNKRLCDYETLGLDFSKPLSEEHASRVLEGCNSYFKNNPYDWFNNFTHILKAADCSYSNGSGCHVDLVQSATFPAWSGLSDSEKNALLAEDLKFFEWQLNSSQIETVLLSGRSVLNAVLATKTVQLEEVSKNFYSNKSGKVPYYIFKGTNQFGKLFIGWSANIPSERVPPEAKIEISEVVGNFISDLLND